MDLKRVLQTIKKRIRSKAGFSLSEVLLAVAILLMASAIVAAGIPAAVRAYTSVNDASHAEMLLSTTMTKLRGELGGATNVEVAGDKKTIMYVNDIGAETQITLKGSGTEDVVEEEICQREYVDYSENGEPAGSSSAEHPLVERAAGGGNIYITYKDVSLDGDVITFSDLEAKTLKGKSLAKMDSFVVRVLTNE